MPEQSTACDRISTDADNANKLAAEVFNLPPNLEMIITVVARIANKAANAAILLVKDSGSIPDNTFKAPAIANTLNAKAGNTVVAYNAVFIPPSILDIALKAAVIANIVTPNAINDLDKSAIGMVDSNFK